MGILFSFDRICKKEFIDTRLATRREQEDLSLRTAATSSATGTSESHMSQIKNSIDSLAARV